MFREQVLRIVGDVVPFQGGNGLIRREFGPVAQEPCAQDRAGAADTGKAMHQHPGSRTIVVIDKGDDFRQVGR